MDDTWIVTKLCDAQTKLSGVCGITVGHNGIIYFTTHSDIIYQARQDNINTETQILVKINKAYMHGIVWNGNNNILYICDYANHRILSYSIDTGNVCTLTGNRKGYLDGNIKDAQFWYPQGIAMDRNGDLYITQEHCVRKINFSSGTVSTIAGSDLHGHKDGDAKQAMFNIPFGIAVSDDGTIYVADWGNCCIRKIKDGIVSTITAPGEEQLSQHLFENSRALVLGVDGNLLVGDGKELRIEDFHQHCINNTRCINACL